MSGGGSLLALPADRNWQASGPPKVGMSEQLQPAVEAFLTEADTVFEEYDQGYMDADAALSRIDAALPELREAIEE